MRFLTDVRERNTKREIPKQRGDVTRQSKEKGPHNAAYRRA
jgi:hypothetical protein